MSSPNLPPNLPKNVPNLEALQALPKERIFLGIKALQFLLLIIIIICEIVQAATFISYIKGLMGYYSYSYYGYGYYSSYSKSDSIFFSPAKLYFTDTTAGKGGSVIWVYIVVIVTLIGIIGYVAMFKTKVWERRTEIYFMAFDAAFVVLWITEVFTNLYWAFKGDESICHGVNSYYYYSYSIGTSYSYYRHLKTACNAYTASNVFGWMVLFSFVLATGFSWKVHNEEKIAAANPTNQFGIAPNNNMTFIPQQPQQPQFAQQQQQPQFEQQQQPQFAQQQQQQPQFAQ
jgi:hypothetical protein